MQNDGNSYSINGWRRGVNNFFEDLVNPSNPQYIQPLPPQSSPNPTSQSVDYVAKPLFQSFEPPPLPSTTYKYPTVTYTPPSLRSSYVPLNASYNDAFYGYSASFNGK